MKNQLKGFTVGATIEWKWLGRLIIGTIKEVHTQPVVKVIKGKSIKRNGSEENPSYLVESSTGNLALKLNTELQLVQKNKANRPSIFST